ncbi:zinc finger BED domain-containing protein RICESLEEPER 2-like [Carya illinoinensis]|uniref:zinc finger BED domain-containing protein RICESLEEPER 2-like n=1 Tax=Carya illinoinensis TaxID=32201 RepID=UPI001C727C23|nr:zinc finger BED domain-containing protein RICESLEEPER 2-like [Carya illinoinensis]
MEDPTQYVENENESVDMNLLESPTLFAREDGNPQNIKDATSTASATSVTSKDPLDHAYERKTRKKTSVVWKDFSIIELPSGEKKSQCKWCKVLLTISRSSSTDWLLQKRVLNFCNVPPPHNGLIIVDTLQKCFVDWGIENKVFTVTFDNAKANDVAIRILKDDFRLRKLLTVGAFDGRLKQFSEITKQLQLPSKKLILDVPTQWNSTYLMLVTTMEFKEVFPRFQDRDQNFQWVTNIVSGSVYPTSNLFLPKIWRMKEVLTAKNVDRNEYIQAMTKKMNEKFEKYWGECNLLMAIAAVLDPRYKMVLIKFCFPLIYPEFETSQNIDLVFKVLHELYDEYVQVHNSIAMGQTMQKNINVSSLSRSTNIFARTMPSGQSMFQSFVRSVDTFQPIKLDLDVYLEEGVYICEEGTDAKFDALEWWKANNLKYKILSKMTRDILAIPISTVASESTFNAGGRVIDSYRASLSIETVQILLCGTNWVRARHGIKKELKEELELAEIILP